MTRRRSHLFYHGTKDEVRIGDHVRIRRLCRSSIDGVVAYIPGISPANRSIEFDGIKQWAIRLADGMVLVSGYYPLQRSTVSKRITLLERSDDPGIAPDEELR
jgi:hypothetical protein